MNLRKLISKPRHGLKQAIVIRSDLSMGRGKMVSQGSHASVLSLKEVMDTDPELAEEWEREGAKKIVLKVTSQRELAEIHSQCKREGLACALVVDAGHTQVDPGTPTAVGIGPAAEQEIDRITGKLKLL